MGCFASKSINRYELSEFLDDAKNEQHLWFVRNVIQRGLKPKGRTFPLEEWQKYDPKKDAFIYLPDSVLYLEESWRRRGRTRYRFK